MKNRKKRQMTLLLIMILIVSVGYAMLSTTLNIDGTTKVKDAKWNIYWDNPEVTTGSVTETKPTIDSLKTTARFDVTLEKPGDFYEFTIDTRNDGTIDAMVDVISKTNLTTTQQKYIDYTVTYVNGTAINKKDALKSGEKKKVKVIVQYKKDIDASDLPQTEETLSLNFSVTYIQADSTAQNVMVGGMLKSIVDYPNPADFHTDEYKEKTTSIVTRDKIEIPATAIDEWDVSKDGDGSVIAYSEDDGKGNGTYKVTICSDGAIYLPVNSIAYFSLFKNLESIDLSNVRSDYVENFTAFMNECKKVKNIDISHFNTHNMTNMTASFIGCNSLEEIKMPVIDAANITTMQATFSNDTSLNSIKLSSKGKVTKLNDLYATFSGCTNLEEVDLTEFDLSNFTGFTATFQRSGIKTFNFDNLNINPTNFKTIDGLFHESTSIENVDLSSEKLSGITSMVGTFENTTSMKTIDLSGIKVANVNFSNGSFKNIPTTTNIKVKSESDIQYINDALSSSNATATVSVK